MIDNKQLLDRILAAETLDRLMNYIKIEKECWIFTGRGTRGKDYRNMVFTFGPERKYVGVHQVMLIQKLGRLLDLGEVVRHKCDTPLCCNPDHLEVGTSKDNFNDMVSRKRRTYRPVQLNLELAREIRKAAQNYTYVQLAKIYNVHKSTIASIVQGKTWREEN